MKSSDVLQFLSFGLELTWNTISKKIKQKRQWKDITNSIWVLMKTQQYCVKYAIIRQICFTYVGKR